MAAPVVLAAVPETASDDVFVSVTVTRLFPPSLAPPVVTEGSEPLVNRWLAKATPSPLAGPLTAEPALLVARLAC